jgi:hypothetical protein
MFQLFEALKIYQSRTLTQIELHFAAVSDLKGTVANDQESATQLAKSAGNS